MLKTNVASLDGIDDKFHPFYTEQPDGTFTLDSELTESGSISALEATNLALKKEKLQIKDDLAQLRKATKAASDKQLEDGNEYKQLLESKQTAWDGERTSLTGKYDALTAKVKSSLINERVSMMAAQLFGENADLLESQVRKRMHVVQDGDSDFSIEILDVKGNASTMSEDDLLSEMRKDKRLQKFIIGRDSSGGGSSTDGGGGDAGDWEKYFDHDKDTYNAEKQFELHQQNPALHDQLFKKHNTGIPGLS